VSPRRKAEILLRAAPITVPCLVLIGAFGAWVFDDAGYPVTAWAPATLLALGLLGVAVVVVPNTWGDVPVAVRVAAVGMSAFTVWSYLSIGWAHDRGAALEGANRTLLYLAIFLLFALWQHRERTAAIVVGGWTLLMLALAFVMLVRVGATGTDARELFGRGDRLAEPAGYPNAAAATWLMVLWPAVALAASSRVAWQLRGLFAAGASVLVPLAVLSLSRGSLFAVPITAVLFLAVFPGRVRHLGVLAIVAATAAAAIPSALDVADALGPTGAGDASDLLGTVARATLGGALVSGLLVGGFAAWETLRPPSAAARETLRRSARIAAAVLVAGIAIGGLVAAGNPIQRVDDGWQSFKGGYGDGTDTGTRLVSGLGSNRYDFYRVALDEFADAPLFGAGLGSFQQAYLREGRSTETPRYPHSLQLRTLSELGLVGAALLALVLGGAAWAGVAVVRRGDPLARAVVAGALGAVLYWTVHGSADWFWEFAGLGGPAFALLGLVCALVPRPEPPRCAPLRARTPAEVLALVVLLGAVGVVVLGPWASRREVDAAADVFAQRPLESYSRLDRARKLDPLSDRPALLEASIALRYGDLDRAERAFTRALDRVPDGQYATLQLGAIASVRGDRERALALLTRAAHLAPRDPLAREALDVVRAGGTVDLVALSRAILANAAQLAP